MTQDNIREKLSQNEFFSRLDDPYIDLLASHSGLSKFEAGSLVFRQGEAAHKFYLLLSGHVSVEIPTVYGPTLQIQNLGAGQVLGWSWLIPPYEWDFQAMVREDSEVIEFDGKALLAACEEDSAFGYSLLKCFTELMSERLAAARQRMMDEWSPSGFA